MLGLSIDKLLVVAIVAAFIIGPQRLPGYARRLGEIVRGARSFLDTARARAEQETGMTVAEWEALDPRRYDPRRIVREALAEPDATGGQAAQVPGRAEPGVAEPGVAEVGITGVVAAESAPVPAIAAVPSGSSVAVPARDALPVAEEVLAPGEAAADTPAVDAPVPDAPGPRYMITGSSGHPRRVLVRG